MHVDLRLSRRTWLASVVAVPMAGCAVSYLPPLTTEAIAPPKSLGLAVRPAIAGQFWVYRQFNMFNSQLVATVTEQVASADGNGVVVRRTADSGQTLPDEVHLPWGLLKVDPVWDVPMQMDYALPLWSPSASAQVPQPGESRLVHGRYTVPGGSFAYWVQDYVVVKGWEKVAVGDTHHTALRIERSLRLAHPDATRIETQRRDVFWLSPDIGRWVARETSGRYLTASGDRRAADEFLEDRFRWELQSWG